jgi:hypothetical protein
VRSPAGRGFICAIVITKAKATTETQRARRVLKKARPTNAAARRRLVSPAGIEPATHSLEGCCSIRLSYEDEGEREIGRGDRIRTYDPLVPNQVRYQTALHPDADLPQQRTRRM